MSGSHDDARAFIDIIRCSVAADPDNLGLRADLIELLLEHEPGAASGEIAELAARGAPASTVEVLRARTAAAMLRRRSAGEGMQQAPPHDGARPAAEHPAPPMHFASPGPSTEPPAPTRSPHAAEPAQPSHAAPHQQDAQPPQPATPAEHDAPIAVDRTGTGTGTGTGEHYFDVDRPGVRLADVAGMTDVKEHLEASFLAPLRNPELARLYGQASRGSLLMYGPPGCGKTFIARAVAGELGANFIHITLADIMGKYFGESEKAIQKVFRTARDARPCVIFFDEFDALGGRRASGGASAQALRMVTSQLLIEFDGVESSNDGIYVLAATNRPWDIDPALRRPGRLDRTVLILPPDAPARAAIIRNGLQGRPAGPVDIDPLVACTAEHSGADLAYIVDTAVQRAFADAMRTGSPRPIGIDDLLRAAATVTPSTRAWFEQVKPVLEYGTDDGTFAQLRAYLRKHRI